MQFHRLCKRGIDNLRIAVIKADDSLREYKGQQPAITVLIGHLGLQIP